jgi:hypothetical protein
MEMPKGTYFHQNHDATATEKAQLTDDERIHEEAKQDFQGSQKDKKAEAISEDEFITEQDRKTEG